MANVKRCDRCGAVYDEYNHPTNKCNGLYTTIYDKRDNSFSRDAYFDLCINCMDKLDKFLKNEPI